MTPFKSNLILVFGLLFLFLSVSVQGQNQLILLKRDDEIFRFRASDRFVISKKGTHEKLQSRIVSINDTTIITSNDTIPIHLVGRIYQKRENFLNVVGRLLIIGGIGYFIVDQFNTVVVQHDKASLDQSVTKASAIAVGSGLIFLLIKKRSQAVRYPYRLLSVGFNSPLYRIDYNPPKGYVSPYIPRN